MRNHSKCYLFVSRITLHVLQVNISCKYKGYYFYAEILDRLKTG
jgi:hypothetical protein